MTTARLTPETVQHLNELAMVLDKIRTLTAEADRLRWLVLDTNQAGTQSAVAQIYGVRRQAVGQWVSARRKTSTGGENA